MQALPRVLKEEEGEANRRTSKRRAELAPAIPSKEEEDEVNRRMSKTRAELAPAIPSKEEEGEASKT